MELEFKDKYVAFLDVLGFKNLVFSEDKELLKQYYEQVQGAFKAFTRTKERLQKLAISDSIILIAENSEEALTELLQAIQTLQAGLALINIWMRGGVSFGEVSYTPEDNTIVGKGFIKAYQLEAQAVYPRVIIDPFIIAKLNHTRVSFCERFVSNSMRLIYNTDRKLSFMNDDAIFVSYGNRIIAISDNQLEDGLLSIYNNIRKNIYGPQEHYHKYQWLKKYFIEELRSANDPITFNPQRVAIISNYMNFLTQL